MYRLLRTLLFLFPAELSHRLVTRLFRWITAVPPLRRWIGRRYRVSHPALRQKIFGIEFDNPVGLAAGFDKNAELTRAMESLGFGFLEVGTVTALPQAGNPRPRLFRLRRDAALINRMGFNNGGAERVARRLEGRASGVPLGINIGRSKVVPNERAPEDYCRTLELLWRHASYLVVNVSSPNTPELRALQSEQPLDALLGVLTARLAELAAEAGVEAPPLLVKIAPDLTDGDLTAICAVVRRHPIAGVVAVNTTIERAGLQTGPGRMQRAGAGGLSGAPLRSRAVEVVGKLRALLGPELPIMGVGGVFDGESARQLMGAGASLIQIYTGLIYQGPGVVRRINRGLLARLRAEGLHSISECVGSAHGS